MRHCILAICVLSVLLAFCVYSSISVQSACDETLEQLLAAQKQLDTGDYSAALALLSGAEDTWRRHEPFFGLVLRHDETDDVLSAFAELRQYTAAEEDSDARAALSCVMEAIRHIRSMSRATVSNILLSPCPGSASVS